MSKPRLHLDADASMRALHGALVARGHDVTRTPNEWIARDAGDDQQLLASTAQGAACSPSTPAISQSSPGAIRITAACFWQPGRAGVCPT